MDRVKQPAKINRHVEVLQPVNKPDTKFIISPQTILRLKIFYITFRQLYIVCLVFPVAWLLLLLFQFCHTSSVCGEPKLVTDVSSQAVFS